VTYTLAADGTSDVVLRPILTWSLKQHETTPVVEQWADFSRVPRQRNLEERLKTAFDLYPCDVLFVHRDAEGEPSELRRAEIANALNQTLIRYIPVVPVRMTEAWLLADEKAIRSAASNPNGRENLNLPDVRRLEDLPDPKRVLRDALIMASGLNARRRSQFRVQQRVHSIPNYIDDYSRLNVLPAFRILQQDIRGLIENLNSAGGR
jgi:hypothetical protein